MSEFDLIIIENSRRTLHCSSSFTKRLARLNCSLASAFATFPFRYHLFAICALRRSFSVNHDAAKTVHIIFPISFFPEIV